MKTSTCWPTKAVDRVVQLVDHLQYARVDALGVVAGQPALGHDIRLDPHEPER